MRIAFDVDGVFADMDDGLRRLQAVSKEESSAASSVERRRLWRSVRRIHNFWETLDEIEPGALSRLRRVSRERQWHVVFLTQRSQTAGDHAQLQTQRWLARHGFHDASVIIVPGARGKLARVLELDVVIDDVAGQCLDVKLESSARAYLIWRRDLAELPPGARRLGITVFNSVSSCLDDLEGLTATPLARIPRLLQSINLWSRPTD